MRFYSQRPTVVLYGRTLSGERVSVIDQTYFPYFYAVPKDQDTSLLEQELKKIVVKVKDDYCSVIKVEKKSMKFYEKETTVLKITYNNQFGINFILNEVNKLQGIKAVYEHDITFIDSYLIDKRIVPGVLTAVEGELVTMRSRIPAIRVETISQSDETIQNPKLLAFDIETYSPEGKSSSPEHDPIMMISFYGNDFKKTITWKDFKTDDKNIEFVKGELELLESFKKTIRDFQPDYLLGYSSDIFAFPYLKKRADKYGMPLDIGLDNSHANITKLETSINGIVHIDLYKFISRVLSSKLESDILRLGEVSLELLGEQRKEIDAQKISHAWDTEHQMLEEFCEYNIQNAGLIYKLAEKLMPSLNEYVKLTNMQLYDVVRGNSSQFTESFLIKESRFWNEIIPNKPSREEYDHRKEHSFAGSYVFEPKLGVYNNIAIFDFTSLYPSIIAVHNISPGTMNCLCCDEQVPGEKYHFCKKKNGFFPNILGGLVDRRQRILKMLGDELEKSIQQKTLLTARQDALKTLANSLYGYFGYPSSRWYDVDCAKAVVAYGKFYINSIIDGVQKAEFDVLYADQDSVFLKLGKKSVEESQRLFEEINMALPEKMQLEYEGFYPRGIFVASKTSTKKKYALLSQQGLLKMRGFEASRRNFSTIAKETQEKVLYYILKERKLRRAVEFVQETISEIKAEKIPLSKTIIYTQMQKDISKYETIAPFVAVAQRMQNQGFNMISGSVIRYIVAKGEGSIADKSRLPNEVHEYDADYYINKQIIPAVENIFEAAGVDFLKALNEKEQSSLAEFI